MSLSTANSGSAYLLNQPKLLFDFGLFAELIELNRILDEPNLELFHEHLGLFAFGISFTYLSADVTAASFHNHHESSMGSVILII